MTEPGTGNGAAGPRTRASEPAPRERLRFGGPLGPDWVREPSAGAGADDSGSIPGAGSGPGGDPGPGARAEPVDPARAASAHECLEWCPVCRTADVARASLPPELRTQLEGVQRDALVAVRAMLDHYIDRLDGHGRPSSRVEDIPIS